MNKVVSKVWIFAWVLVGCAIFLMTLLRPVSAAKPRQEEGGAPTPTRTATVTPIHLIVGVGQSNMAGRAVSGSIATVPTGAFMMKWDPVEEQFYWTQMEEPSSVWNGIRTVTPGGTKEHGAVPYNYSPASALMTRLMIAKGWSKLAFINCAVGGSTVHSWAPSFPSATDAVNFNYCWQRITSAQSTNHYKVVAVVVINGESEANPPEPVAYATDMGNLYLAFNVRLQTLTPSGDRTAIPMVFLLLSNTIPDASKPHWVDIRGTQIKLPTIAPGKNWDSADSDGIYRDSNYHFYYRSDADTIGISLADVLLALPALPPSTPSRTPTPTFTPTP